MVRRAWSLLELLTVIAIISILMAMLVPAAWHLVKVVRSFGH